jgi:alkaline phosphatase D
MRIATRQKLRSLVFLFQTGVLCTAISVNLAKGVDRSTVYWVWSGAVTTDSAVVKARLQPGTNTARLLVDTTSSFTDPVSFPSSGYVEPDPDGVATFRLTGLNADTAYHYSVEIEGQRRLSGKLHTFAQGPMSFRVAFGSCATTGSNHEIFSTIEGMNPLFFLHMGDFHYENIAENDPALFQDAFEEVLASQRQSSLYRSSHIVYIWDDHDYGPNDSDRLAKGRPAALKVYRQYVPHYPLFLPTNQLGTIQQAFTVGRVRFILTDGRSQRDPTNVSDGPKKSMLGVEQRGWLFKELASAKDYALVVWVNVVPWITKSQVGSDIGWEPFSYERTQIADEIKGMGLVNRMLILSGDGHMVAIDDGTNSDYSSDGKADGRAFPVVQAAPIDRFPRVKGGPYSHGVAARTGVTRLFGLIKEQQFGFMNITDTGQVIDVELSGRNSKGEILKGMLLKMRCDSEGCKVVD